MNPQLPRPLAQLLTTLQVPHTHVQDVVHEATPKCPWVVSVDREASGRPQTYATVRPSGIKFFDTYDDALADSGGAVVPEQTGCYYELVDATKPGLEIPFRPPLSFRGQVGDLLLLTAPAGSFFNSAQAAELRAACRLALTAATKSGAVSRDAVLQPFILPEGTRIVRLIERSGPMIFEHREERK